MHLLGNRLAGTSRGGLAEISATNGAVITQQFNNSGSNATATASSLLGALTVGGAVTLPGDPVSALQAATKQYVDSTAGTVADIQSITATGTTTWTKPSAARPSRCTCCPAAEAEGPAGAALRGRCGAEAAEEPEGTWCAGYSRRLTLVRR